MKRILLLALAGFLFSGCASIVTGTDQTVTFISSPEGATVNVGGRTLGKTPLTVMLKKEKGQTITFTKDGYKKLRARLDTQLNPWFWGNIVLGGVIGSTIDVLSGTVNEYSPTQYMATLVPDNVSRLEEPLAKGSAQKTREFIIIGYANLLKDLSAGEGQYLSSLLSMIEVPEEKSEEAKKKIHALSEAYANIPEFADHVIALYPGKQPIQTNTPNPPSVVAGLADNKDGTITDNETGLVWQKDDDGIMRKWEDSGSYCRGLSLAGHSDWVLPSKDDIATIVVAGNRPTTIDTRFFPTVKPFRYWTSSTKDGNSIIYAVDFGNGTLGIFPKSITSASRCVRGGSQAMAKNESISKIVDPHIGDWSGMAAFQGTTLSFNADSVSFLGGPCSGLKESYTSDGGILTMSVVEPSIQPACKPWANVTSSVSGGVLTIRSESGNFFFKKK